MANPLATVRTRANSSARSRAAFDAAIVAAVEAGYSLRQVADAAGMTHVNVLKIVRRVKN